MGYSRQGSPPLSFFYNLIHRFIHRVWTGGRGDRSDLWKTYPGLLNGSGGVSVLPK